jgi:hypothetical protein
VESPDFTSAVTRPADPGIRLRRICIWIYIKAHASILIWDTLLDDSRSVIEHRIHESSSCCQEAYPYKDDFREGKVQDSILRAFSEALRQKGHLNTLQSNVHFFNNNAYMSTFIGNLFSDAPKDRDMACVAFQILVTIYMCMVENAVTRDDTVPVFRFASHATRKYFRFVTKSFHDDLIDFLVQQIQCEHHAVLLPASMAAPTLNAKKVRLVSLDREGKRTEFVYGGFENGFVQVSPDA